MATAPSVPSRRSSRARQTLPPDHVQRERIVRELDRCLLVEAGAGAGKTERLVARMIELLATGACTSATLAAITFTHKAAAELRARFQIALEQAVRAADGARRLRLQAALEHVEQAFIGTIHSFCGRLLRERPVEANVDVAFTEVDESVDQQLRQQAWELYVAELHLREDSLLGELEKHGLEISALADAFFRYANYPDVHDWHAPRVEMPDLAPAAEALRSYSQHMRRVEKSFPADTGNDKLMPCYRLLPRLVRQAELTNPAALLGILEHFRELELRNLVQRSWPGGNSQARSELTRWNEFTNQYAAPLVEAWRAVRYPLVLRVLQSTREVYDRLRRGLGCLNFQDLLLRGAALLRDQPDVRRSFRERITHLLVDEFQDTDPVQAAVMLLLTADDPAQSDWRQCRPVPGSLFIVADPKQSIYRFRRADVSTYQQVKQTLIDGGGAVVELWANFRSQGPLVDWINQTFLGVFPEVATAQMPARRPMEAGRSDAAPGSLSGIFLLRLPDCGDKRALSEYEADRLARTIRQALDAGLTVPRTDKELQQGITSSVRPKDFLIVTRTTKQLGIYARKLEEYRIPYQMTGGSAWDDVPELALLALCLRAVTLPDDPLALVAVLRSELFGFSDAELYALVKVRGKFHYRVPLPKGLEADIAARYADAFGRLRGYGRWLQQLPPVAAVEKMVADLGLAVRAAAGLGGNGRAGTLAKALELLRAAQADLPSVTELLATIDRLTENRERFNGVPARPHAGSVVRLMNLHQVKGLEAPIVFLADPSGAWEHTIDLHIDRSGDAVRGHLAVHAPDSGYQPKLLACPPDWEALSALEREYRRAEEQRLLYVAATRPGTQLTITQRSRFPQWNPWRFFEPHLAGHPELADPGQVAVPVGSAVTVSVTDRAQANADIAQRWTEVRRASYVRAGIKETTLVGRAGSGDGHEHGQEWGTVLHRLIQGALTALGTDLLRLAVRSLKEHELDPSLAEAAVQTVQDVLVSALGRRAQASPQRFVEMPFQVESGAAGKGPPAILSGVIDLVFREADGWVLVDWKTDVLSAAGLANRIAYYRPQVSAYTDIWQQLTGEPVRECVLYFTHLQRSVSVALEAQGRRSSMVKIGSIPGPVPHRSRR